MFKFYKLKKGAFKKYLTYIFFIKKYRQIKSHKYELSTAVIRGKFANDFVNASLAYTSASLYLKECSKFLFHGRKFSTFPIKQSTWINDCQSYRLCAKILKCRFGGNYRDLLRNSKILR